jgi:hypothetical protein
MPESLETEAKKSELTIVLKKVKEADEAVA